VQRPSAGPAIRPLAGATPIRPSVAIQRSTTEDADADDEPGGGVLPTPWWAPAPDPVRAGAAGAGSGLDAGLAIQRSVASGAIPMVAVSPAARPGSQADRVAARPAARSASVQRSTAVPSPVAMPVRGVADHTHARGPLALPPAAGADAAPAQASGHNLIVQTSPAPGADRPAGAPIAGPALPGSVPVQRADDPKPTPVAQAASNQPDHRSEQELDRLAQQLFGRIRGRIRSELIHDREAQGLTFDSI
jgi:hypothetical protein